MDVHDRLDHPAIIDKHVILVTFAGIMYCALGDKKPADRGSPTVGRRREKLGVVELGTAMFNSVNDGELKTSLEAEHREKPIWELFVP